MFGLATATLPSVMGLVSLETPTGDATEESVVGRVDGTGEDFSGLRDAPSSETCASLELQVEVQATGTCARVIEELSISDGLQAEGAGEDDDETCGTAASAVALRAGVDEAGPTGTANIRAAGPPCAPANASLRVLHRLSGGTVPASVCMPEPEPESPEVPARTEGGEDQGEGELFDPAIGVGSDAGVLQDAGVLRGALCASADEIDARIVASLASLPLHDPASVLSQPEPLLSESERTESAGLRFTGLSPSPQSLGTRPAPVFSALRFEAKSRGTTGDPTGDTVRSLRPHPPVPPDKTACARTLPEGPAGPPRAGVRGLRWAQVERCAERCYAQGGQAWGRCD